jgi:hypothetical protein
MALASGLRRISRRENTGKPNAFSGSAISGIAHPLPRFPLINRLILRMAGASQRSFSAEPQTQSILHQCQCKQNSVLKRMRETTPQGAPLRVHTNTSPLISPIWSSQVGRLSTGLVSKNEPDGHPRLCGRDLSTICTKHPTIVNTAKLSNLSHASIPLSH